MQISVTSIVGLLLQGTNTSMVGLLLQGTNTCNNSQFTHLFSQVIFKLASAEVNVVFFLNQTSSSNVNMSIKGFGIAFAEQL